ncbi:helix-turn-helix domain-containing protein [Pararhizobium gei]|uniref:helix-turn-helix domain-containing protein n=1 Tax=Pararhizobium gei TaxID=1395951 RepID=UPI0023DC436D|nr:helix-turn-helix transcriptional regulator [Rhizobium gei]
MFDLKIARNQMGVTQAEMAAAMGVPIRTYEDIEAGRSKCRPAHVAAAKWAMVQLAATRRDVYKLPENISQTLKDALEYDEVARKPGY